MVESIHTSTLVLWKEESMVIQNVLEKAKLTPKKKNLYLEPMGKTYTKTNALTMKILAPHGHPFLKFTTPLSSHKL